MAWRLDYDPNYREGMEKATTVEEFTRKSLQNPKLIGTLAGPEEFIPKQHRHLRLMNFRELDCYNKKMDESDGFDVSGCTGRLHGGIVEATHPQILEHAGIAAKFAVEEHNSLKGSKLKFVELVKANAQGLAGIRYYNTLKAVYDGDDQPKTYRAKVFVDCINRVNDEDYGPMRLEYFELAPSSSYKKRKLAQPSQEEILAYRRKLRSSRHLALHSQAET